MMNGTDYELSFNKLTILMMLKLSSYPLTNARISDFVMDHNHVNYFTIQDYLAQLEAAGHIQEETLNHQVLYGLTDSGLETLSFFSDRIPENTQQQILDYLKHHAIEIRSIIEVVANYIPDHKGGYHIHCVVKDDDVNLLTFSMTVYDHEAAMHICDKWKKEHGELYKSFLNQLLKPTTPINPPE